MFAAATSKLKCQSHDVPSYLRGVGTVIAFNSVIVRSQITGQLVKIAFKQGQVVKKGDLLGEIDPSPYQAQLDQAIANRDRDQAHLENAKIDLDRYTKLAQQKSIATQTASNIDQLVAMMIKSDEAIIESAGEPRLHRSHVAYRWGNRYQANRYWQTSFSHQNPPLFLWKSEATKIMMGKRSKKKLGKEL